jgi:hypothetical protein
LGKLRGLKGKIGGTYNYRCALGIYAFNSFDYASKKTNPALSDMLETKY